MYFYHGERHDNLIESGNLSMNTLRYLLRGHLIFRVEDVGWPAWMVSGSVCLVLFVWLLEELRLFFKAVHPCRVEELH